MTALACAVLTISDTRTAADDTSGDLLVELLTGAGHRLVERAIDRDDIYAIRATVSRWIADSEIQVILTHRRHRLHRPRQHSGSAIRPVRQDH